MLNSCVICLLKKLLVFVFLTFSTLSLEIHFMNFRESNILTSWSIDRNDFINFISLQSIGNSYISPENLNILIPHQFNLITNSPLLFKSVQEQSYVYERTMSNLEQRLSHKFNSIENRSLIPITQNIIKKKEKLAFHDNTHIEYINETTEKIILSRLSKFEDQYAYLHKSTTLGKLATELNTNVKYLSIVIKKHKAENFNHYINELRIKYIIEKLTHNEDFLKYKISYLSDLCGYSSPAAFTKSFIEITGQTPSEFIKSLNK